MALAASSETGLGTQKSRRVLGKALMQLQGSWNFTNVEMARLIRIKPNTYGLWKTKKEVPFQAPPYSTEIELIIALLSIFRSLGAMFVSATDQVLWLKTPHPRFGRAPLEFAKTSCENLFFLKHYLDYVRGRGA